MDQATTVLAAASAALGTPLTDPRPLPGSDRSLVLRVRAADRSYVLKAPLRAGPGPVREAAALRVLAGRPGAPQLLAESIDPPVLVMADLGTGPSLADALLGEDPDAAVAALHGWVDALAGMTVATTGLRPAFEAELAALSPLGPPPTDGMPDLLDDAAGTLARLLPRLGVTSPPAALDELRALAPGGPAALTPGDVCPDNNIRTGDGYTLLDFEVAEFRSVAWDAAYLRLPFPTCWCAWAVPDPVADAALARWSEQVRPPAGFGAEIEEAAVAWAFITTSWFLPQVLSGGDDGPADRPAPTRRAAIQHRLSRVSRGGPLGDLAAELLAALAREYGDHPLLPAPAFR